MKKLGIEAMTLGECSSIVDESNWRVAVASVVSSGLSCLVHFALTMLGSPQTFHCRIHGCKQLGQPPPSQHRSRSQNDNACHGGKCVGVPNGGTLIWMVYKGKFHLQMDDLGVPPFMETPAWKYVDMSALMI